MSVTWEKTNREMVDDCLFGIEMAEKERAARKVRDCRFREVVHPHKPVFKRPVFGMLLGGIVSGLVWTGLVALGGAL